MPNHFISCKKCGSEYVVKSIKLFHRDKDSIDCIVCGSELRSWNGAESHVAYLVRPRNTDSAVDESQKARNEEWDAICRNIHDDIADQNFWKNVEEIVGLSENITREQLGALRDLIRQQKL